MSTVRGKKSMPSRTPLSALAVTSTTVLPIFPTTAPCDWGARRPVSNVSVLSVPLIGPDTEMASAIVRSFESGGGGGQFPVVEHPANIRGPHDWQLTSCAPHVVQM